MILPTAEVVPSVSHSFFCSSSPMWTSRSSNATENGINRSPGLFSSIQAYRHTYLWSEGTYDKEAIVEARTFDLGKPLVLLADVVLLAHVNEVDDRLGRQELKAINNVNLSCLLFLA